MRTLKQTHEILVLHISLSRSHKSRWRTISGCVLCVGAGRGSPEVKGGGTSLNTTAAASKVRPSWPFLLFGLGVYATSCATKAAKALPRSALSKADSKPGNFSNDQLRKWGKLQRCSFCLASSPCTPWWSAQTQGRTRRVEPSWHFLQSSSPHC